MSKLAFLSSIEIPIHIRWPRNCSCVRVDRWAFNTPVEFFNFVKNIAHPALFATMVQDVVVLINGRQRQESLLVPITRDPKEISDVSNLLAIIHADKLMQRGYAFPPTNVIDQKDRSSLVCSIAIQEYTTTIPLARLFENKLRENIDILNEESTNIQNDSTECILKIHLKIWLSRNSLKTNQIYNYYNVGYDNNPNIKIPLNIFFEYLRSKTFEQTGKYSGIILQNLGHEKNGSKINSVSETLQESSNHNTELVDFYMQIITRRESSTDRSSTRIRPFLDLINVPDPSSHHIQNALGTLNEESGLRLKNHQKNAIELMHKYEEEGFEERFWITFDGFDTNSTRNEIQENHENNQETLEYCPAMNCLRIKNNGSIFDSIESGIRGGFLCDDTGLGKTLSLLSLSCITSQKGPTLVVVPLSVLQHWKKEARKLHNIKLGFCQYDFENTDNHNTPELFHYYLYYGQSRIRNYARLEAENNVIITTYTTLQRDYSMLRGLTTSLDMSEFDKRKCPLLFIKFHRLILDESHKISYSYKKVISKIRTNIRWCVTATPLGDGVHCPSCKDQFDILLDNDNFPGKVLPIDNKSWKNQVTNLDISLHTSMTSVVTNSDNSEVRFVPPILLSLLRNTMVRNNEQHANSLQYENLIPKVEHVKLFCEFSQTKKIMYSEQLSQIKNRIQTNRHNGAVSTRMFNSFRRWISLGGHCVSSVMNLDVRPDVLSEAERNMLHIPEDICNICLEDFEEPCVLPCNHFLCYGCALNMANMSVRTKCPMCRRDFEFTQLRLYDETSQIQEEDNHTEIPEKIQKIADYIHDNNLNRVVVFSEFKSTQQSIVTHMKNLRPEYTVFQLNGSMSSSKRGKVMDTFSACEKAVIVLSVRACAAGINLQCANTLFFMEPMLMKTQESQAIGRIKRIGQLSSTIKIVHLIYKDSIEEPLHKQSSDWRPSVANLISLLNS